MAGERDAVAAIHDLDPAGLDELCARLRKALVRSVARRGGHLGSNLGVVELSVALHRIFTAPDDVILWDTGHQAYVHKMLTGRIDEFDSLRSFGGLSGYPNRAESPHDWVENSHAGTALSYAAGIATARGLAPAGEGSGGQVVAVIGDGSLTAGMAFEALNDIGERDLDLVVVLNDNGRSYAPTTGALARQLDRARAGERPPFFDSLGVRYLGPVDGHDVSGLEKALGDAAGWRGPVVVHVVTEKGRGYSPALADTVDHMHGVGPFDPASGRPYPLPDGRLSSGAILGPALTELAGEVPELVVVTPAMGSASGLDGYAAAFPDRFFDVGIAEQHAVTFAAGLAMAGGRPFVSIHSTFLNRAFDQTLLDVGLHDLPVVLLLDRAGVTGGDGPSHHGLADLGVLRMVPNLAIGTPSSAGEFRELLRAAAHHDGPVAIRYGKAIDAEPIDAAPAVEPVEIGRWDVTEAPGGVLVLGLGDLLPLAAGVAGELTARGVPAAPVNARWVAPLDDRLVALAARHRLLVTVEDHWTRGGLGSAVRERLADLGVPTPVLVCGVPHDYLPHGEVDVLRRLAGLNVEVIVERVLAGVAGPRGERPV